MGQTVRSWRTGWPRSIWASLFGICALCWCGLWTFASSYADELRPGEAGVLLLEGNRVVTGKITRQGESYAIEQPAGTLVISAEKVLYVASNLSSVYVHLQDTLPRKPKADDHVELARWCISYKLISEARFELEAALEADPSRNDIRRNLTKLDALLKRPLAPSEPAKAETPAERLAKRSAGLEVEVESLGGLSREAGQEYTRRVQPILIRTCTASACHGPLSSNEFKLALIPYGSTATRSTTEKNLLALLSYVDRENPRDGTLWKLLKTNHGAKGSSIFLGAKGKDQLAMVQKWLLSISEDVEVDPVVAKPKSASKIEQSSYVTEGKPRWRKGDRPPKSPSLTTQIPDAEVVFPKSAASRMTTRRTANAENPSTSAAVPEQAEVDPIVSEERPVEPSVQQIEDPFDPAEFNRQQRIKRAVTR